ncbi:hypothetical protein M3P21_11590 [Ruegeria sp. 2012CJ41-6]|uniref:Uncharacterized protein n=1 Tax=Ruegeria spongiae TaxID=2942209 RepID=A0ABT0Q2R6_9RHOB|nr:hypothetical protein [Ruegeria spongiae]MCL6284168.1 hypothetical protein [Ruegeria spongiae]
MTDHIVFCSGPMFSVGDLWEQYNIAAVLEAGGFGTYLAPRDGVEIAKMMGLLQDPEVWSQQGQEMLYIILKVGYAQDIYQLLGRCSSLVFNMDGRVPDGGSIVEVTTAYAAGLPLVIYKTTPVTLFGGVDNPMLQGLSTTWEYAHNTATIVPALLKRIEAQSHNSYTYTPPPNVSLVMEVGAMTADAGSELRRYLSGISNAPNAKAALEAGQKLIEWSKTNKAYQAAFGASAVM